MEADPAGGDLALRLSGPAGQVLPRSPSIAGLAVESPASLGWDRAWHHAMQTSVGVSVVCGLVEAEPMGIAIRQHGKAMAQRLVGTDTIVDAGRLVPGTVMFPFAVAADAIVLVVGDSAEHFFHARDLLSGLLPAVTSVDGTRPAVQAVVVADSGRGMAAVAELRAVLDHQGIPVTVAGWVARDRKGLQRWLAGDRGAGRSVLLRSAGPVVAEIAASQAGAPRARQTSLPNLTEQVNANAT
ncbi:MAG: hypothetical protein EPN43_08525 [Jatrophihabitans sp.]|nr:MAG: hypothetical protein EPN43_08525 [Jatrophihabitans sp.]